MLFWNSCFFNDPTHVGNLISGSSAFSKSNLNIWKLMLHVLLKPGLENFECLVSLIFLKRSLVFPSLLFSPMYICVYIYIFCIDHLGRLSYLSLLFFGTLHSNECIFPFLLCLSLLFFSQLFVRPPQTTILPFCICFLGDDFVHCSLHNFMSLLPQFFRHSVYQI